MGTPAACTGRLPAAAAAPQGAERACRKCQVGYLLVVLWGVKGTWKHTSGLHLGLHRISVQACCISIP
jgi:hypothetical protein